MKLADILPAPVRKAIYTGIAAASTTEAALDPADWGVIPDDVQLKALIVLAALGFSLARANTPA